MAEQWIIVGAGSAGCVLANRLSADGTRSITLLDDGPGLDPGQVPAGISGPSFFAAMGEPGRMHDELLATRAAGIESSVYQRGRGIGGSSAVNAMVALRGSEDLYRSWGWTDTEAAWDRVLIPAQRAAAEEVGVIDRALRADPRTEPTLMTRTDGQRVTAAEAYLWPALSRSNLTVRPNAEVQRIVTHDRVATGVELTTGETLTADRIIVSAGAIHSPVILLRSGIDTPGIGAGLQDHPSVVFALLLKDANQADPGSLPIASVLHESVDGNLLQLLPLNNLGPAPEAAGLGALMAALMTPVGRAGSVGIDAQGNPVIDFALLDDDRDVKALADAAQLALDVLQTPAFQAAVEEVYIDDVGTTAASLSSPDAIVEWVRANCADYVHASSTCAMGTVVDERGAVNGYQNLFVCDASVFPSIPDANTHLPTTMLAERLSSLLAT